jgi:hypothetical protein
MQYLSRFGEADNEEDGECHHPSNCVPDKGRLHRSPNPNLLPIRPSEESELPEEKS